MALSAVISASVGGAVLVDLTSRASSLSFGTNVHGFATLDAFYPCSLLEAFSIYDRAGLPHVAITDNSATVWEGRLEDVAIVPGGVRLKAFGYQRAFSDIKYTAHFSSTRVDDWRPVLLTERSDAYADRYDYSTQNQLYITPKKNATLGTTTVAKVGRIGWEAPSNGSRQIVGCSFSYALTATSAWSAAFQTGGATWGVVQTGWSSAGSVGVEISGTQSVSFASSPADTLMFYLYYNAADAAYAGETGDYYLRITNLRYWSSAASALYASEIAGALVSYVYSINPSQVANSGALLNTPGIDLTDQVYQDEYPADILTRLAAIGDTNGTTWEWGVYDGRILHFRQRGSAGRTWFVDAADLQIERTIDTLYNSAYAVYTAANGRTMRTAASTATASISRYAVTRQTSVKANTSSSAAAVYVRDVALTDGKDPSPRIGLTFARLYDAAGGLWPLWACRSGDTIVIRNLPPTVSTSIDRIRSFRVSETSYDAAADVLSVTPETPLPQLDVFIAQKSVGAV